MLSVKPRLWHWQAKQTCSFLHDSRWKCTLSPLFTYKLQPLTMEYFINLKICLARRQLICNFASIWLIDIFWLWKTIGHFRTDSDFFLVKLTIHSVDCFIEKTTLNYLILPPVLALWLKAPYYTKIDILLSKKSLINWYMVVIQKKNQLVSRYWTGSKMKWFL